MLANSRLLTADALHSAHRLPDVLHRERVGPVVVEDPSDFGPCEIGVRPALIEQAKGALMLHYGIDSHQAFAVLIGWGRVSGTPVATIAHTLLRGICEGNPQTEVRQRALMRWLEAQLRESDPGHGQLRTAPARHEPAQETPRSD